MIKYLAALLYIVLFSTFANADWQFSSGLEYRYFAQEEFNDRRDSSAAFFEFESNNSLGALGDNSYFISEIEIKKDFDDNNRSLSNVKVFKYAYYADSFEFNLGFDQIFWGVVESKNLVDVVNQVNYPQDTEGKDKLGQLMGTARYAGDIGDLSFHLLLGFREREYPAQGEILALPLREGDAQYESEKGDEHIDVAFRWFRNFGQADVAVSYFHGTNRDPQYALSGLSPTATLADLELLPYYSIIDQVGLEFQYNLGNTAVKLESIVVDQTDEDRYLAAVAGVEYTQSNVAGIGLSIGWIAEYLHDSRGDDANSFLEHDILVALRLGFNDVRSTNMLLKVLTDTQTEEAVIGFEGQSRILKNVTFSFDSQFYRVDESENNSVFSVLQALADPDKKLTNFYGHSYITLELTYHF